MDFFGDNIAAEIAAATTSSEFFGTKPDNVVYKYNPDVIPESTTVCEASPREEEETKHATYDSNSIANIIKKYNNITVKRNVDELGRTFYHFDDHGFNSMVVIIFTTPAGELISINDVVMPLEKLLNTAYINQFDKNEKSVSKTGLREVASDPKYSEYGTVYCRTGNDQDILIKNTNVKNMMMLISILLAEKEKVNQSPKSAASRSACIFHAEYDS